jgi:hypothetical protein
MFGNFLGGILDKLKKIDNNTKLIAIAVMVVIATWLVCKKVSGDVPALGSLLPQPYGGAPSEPVATEQIPPAKLPFIQTVDYVPGAYLEDPGYGSGVGSIGAVKEGFTPECLGLNGIVDYPDTPFYQVACDQKYKFDWNLPLDYRMQHRAMYGEPNGVATPKCQRRHPMNSIYAPPNEGIDLEAYVPQ